MADPIAASAVLTGIAPGNARAEPPPACRGILTEGDVDALVRYIRLLAFRARADAPRATGSRQQKRTVPVGKEAIARGDRVGIDLAHALGAHQGRDQHHQG